MSSMVDADVTAVDDGTTVFRAYEHAEFLEWPAWKRLQSESIRTDLDPQAQSQVRDVLTNPEWRAAIGKDGSRRVLADRILAWLRQDKRPAP